MSMTSGIIFQVLQSLLVVLIAPLMLGWVNQCRAWLQNKSGAGIWQPYKVLHKLFHKDAVLAHTASPLFRATPYILFACMWLAVGIVPVLQRRCRFAGRGRDRWSACSRWHACLCRSPAWTALRSALGARREMISSGRAGHADDAVAASLISHSTSLATIVRPWPAPVRDLQAWRSRRSLF
jgi:hypothetical protein